MKRAFHQDSLKKVFYSLNRFMTILIITAIGIAFFTGLRATAPSMFSTASSYYQEQNFMDIQIFSNVGFSSQDVEDLTSLTNIKEVTPEYRMDAFTSSKGQKLTVLLISTDSSREVNQPFLVEGRLPSKDNECLVDLNLTKKGEYQLGDTVSFSLDNTKTLPLTETTFTIVGIAKNPEFLATGRGSSALGSGQIAGFFYLPKTVFNLPVYTGLSLTINKDSDLDIFSDEYKDLVDTAKIEIKNLPAAENWYVLDHESNLGIVSYEQDANRIKTLSLVIPLLFFLISIMVTMTSMTRLVESDLTLIGTYKALGYYNITIALRYLFYAISASFIGAILGIVIGYLLFPRLIIDAYGSLYDLSAIKLNIEASLIILASGIAVFSAAVPAFIVALTAMREVPSELMRPAAPIKGKVILLERLKPLWSRFSFSQKIMLRNLFRYKKRLFMTLLGVAGCTALMFTGFGLKDSLTSIVDAQYNSVFNYDVEVQLQENISTEEKAGFQEFLLDHPVIEDSIFIRKENMKIVTPDASKDLNTVVLGEDQDVKDLLSLHDRKTQKPLALNSEGVIISEKLSELYDLKVGSTLTLKQATGQEALVKVTGIMENYLLHYVFMTDTFYAQIFKETPVANTVLSSTTDTSKKTEENLFNEISKVPGVNNVVFTSFHIATFQDSIDALTFVVLVLILSAAALVFVVLFSLTSINIEERKRELATLKVLGFKKFELISYIFKEGIILTILGAFLGLLLGYFLHSYIISTMEIDVLMFGRIIRWQSYLYSFLLTLFFATIVNSIMIYQINKIDMISSLKSIE